jgi:hypothetical protein
MKKVFFSILVLFIVVACEKTGTDVDPQSTDKDPSGLVENTQSIYYTWQGNDVAIDVRSFQNLSNINTIDITEQPDFGIAKFDNNFLYYSPNFEVIEAEDQIVVEIKTKDNKIKKEVVYFKIKSKPTDIPCHTGALPDRFDIETNQNKVLDVLSNDLFCDDANIVSGSLKIAISSKNGEAKLVGEKVSYTPNSGFKGEDRFVYEFLAKGTDGKEFRRTAAVQLRVADKNGSNGACKTKLIDDLISIPQSSPLDTIWIKPLQNDFICNQGTTFTMSIENPKNGVAKLLSNNTIMYIFPKTNFAPSQFIDVIKYKVKQGNEESDAQISLKTQAPPKDLNNCKTKLVDDNISIFLSKPKPEMNKGVLFLDVLGNEAHICGDIKDFKIIDAPKGEKITFETIGKYGYGFIKYEPTGGKFVKGELLFSYQVTDGKGVVNSAKVKVKFVD